jgi:hypothetical protein
MVELERRIAEAAESFRYAPTPDLVQGALGRLEQPSRSRRRPFVLAAAAALALTGAALAASPAARSEIGDLLNALPGIGVEEVAELPPFPPEVVPGILGERTTLAEAERVTGLRVEAPEIESLGPPSAVYARRDVVGGKVTLVYGDEPRLLLTQWRGSLEQADYQLESSRSRAETVELAGRSAVWLEGNVQATLQVIGTDGRIHLEQLRLRGNALLWQRGEKAYRLETAGTKDQAIEIAKSFE